MRKLFNNILVPVDFTKVSEPAVKRAIDIANDFSCNLHLLHAVHPSLVSLPREGHLFHQPKNEHMLVSEEKLKKLVESSAGSLREGLTIEPVIRKGNLERTIIEYTIQQRIDLIILGKSPGLFPGTAFHNLSINRISRKLPCPVLTVKSGPVTDKVQNIVMPVGASLPLRKIMFVTYLASRFESKIHLISLTRRFSATADDDTAYLFKTYQMLRDHTNLPVECHTVHGENIAETTLDYAQKIHADLIVVNPGKELLLPGFINRLFARFLVNESRIPVMTVAPAH